MATHQSRLEAVLAQIGDDIQALSNGLPFTFADPLTARDGLVPLRMQGSGKILGVTAAVKTAPTGSALVVDMLKNSTTIFTGGTGRPSIAASAFSAVSSSVPVSSYSDGDLFLPKIVSVGSTVAGAGLCVTLWVRRTG